MTSARTGAWRLRTESNRRTWVLEALSLSSAARPLHHSRLPEGEGQVGAEATRCVGGLQDQTGDFIPVVGFPDKGVLDPEGFRLVAEGDEGRLVLDGHEDQIVGVSVPRPSDLGMFVAEGQRPVGGLGGLGTR